MKQYTCNLWHFFTKTVYKCTEFLSHNQGHLFAMEVSSGEEYYIASDNTGTPLAVFSSNGQMIKQVIYKVTLNINSFAVNYCQDCRKIEELNNIKSAYRKGFWHLQCPERPYTRH